MNRRCSDLEALFRRENEHIPMKQETNMTTEATSTWNASDANSTAVAFSGALPLELTFSSDGLLSVVSYSVMFVIGSIGNVTGTCSHRASHAGQSCVALPFG